MKQYKHNINVLFYILVKVSRLSRRARLLYLKDLWEMAIPIAAADDDFGGDLFCVVFSGALGGIWD